MKDKVEEFFEAHRDEFDVHEPRPHLWGAVYEELHKEKKHQRLKYYAMAASVLLIMGVAVLLFQKKQGTPVAVGQHDTDVTISPEMQEAESYYTSIVEVKQSELSKYSKDYPDLCKEFEKQVKDLNVLYAQLKQEYKNSNGREAVLKAMIDNLQVQAQIANKQLQILETVKEKDTKYKPGV